MLLLSLIVMPNKRSVRQLLVPVNTVAMVYLWISKLSVNSHVLVRVSKRVMIPAEQVNLLVLIYIRINKLNVNSCLQQNKLLVLLLLLFKKLRASITYILLRHFVIPIVHVL